MDENRFFDVSKAKNDDFFLTIENGLTEDQIRSQKKVDAFFDKLESNKLSRIKDDPKEAEGTRFVTKDKDVVVYRTNGDNSQIYKIKEQEKAEIVKNNTRGVKKSSDSSKGNKKGDFSSNKNLVPKPGRKKSVFVRVLGILYGILWRTIIILGCLGVIAGCALVILGSTYLINVTKDDDQNLNLNNVELTYSSMLMVNQINEEGEEEWVEYQRIFGGENRVWLKYNDMPQHLINAIVASEDQRFWEHDGVDWKRTIAAFINAYIPGVSFFSGTQGGSTLAQQLIKNITDEDESEGLDGALRKMREIYRALILEKKYSREQILESYLNTFRLSGQVAGIEAGANYYFDKSTKNLTVAECAAIVCITKAPGAHNPYQYPDNNRIQRDTIINQMYEQGYLSESEWKRAKSESERMVFSGPPEIQTGTNVYSYFCDMVIDEVLSDFVKYEFNGCKTYEDAYRILTRGGLRIYMTMNPEIQDVMDDVRLNGRRTEDDERSAYPSDPNGYLYPIYKSRPLKDDNGDYVIDDEGNRVMDDTQPQSAFVVMDMKGEIKGVVGGLGEKTESRSFNRASMGTRSTGSSMKPIAAYGPALEVNAITFSTLWNDDPLPPGTVQGAKEWPRNYDRTYGPPVTVAAGIARSLNTTAVWTLHSIGYDFSFTYIKSFLGLDSLDDPGDRTYSLCLGGLYNGVTPIEMCAAYASFGNGGYYYSPHSYTVILNAQGEVVFDKEKYVQKIKAFGDDTAYIMNRLLYNVMHPGFSGTGINATPSGSMEYVGKSGTHTDDMDFWFVGMNPYYVMAVWQGYDVQDRMESVRPHPVQLVFRKVMTEISADLEPIDFLAPETGVRQRRFCMASGDLASGECTETRLGYYKDDYIPPTCDHAHAPDPNDPIYAWPRPDPATLIPPPPDG